MDYAQFHGAHMGTVWRVVETQEVAATREITQSAQQQSRLETLLDFSKPELPEDCTNLSYLMATPFRYPPLKYGSRFGSTWERGIYYASLELETGLAEAALYLWLFQDGLHQLGPLEQIKDQRTSFSVKIKSSQALDLRAPPFDKNKTEITDPISWAFCQQLGKEIRACGTEFFWYPSARHEGGTNVAVLTPKAFARNNLHEQSQWNLRLDAETCWFGQYGGASYEFHRTQFEADGKIQHPVNHSF